jgi:acetyl esterase/lipase
MAHALHTLWKITWRVLLALVVLLVIAALIWRSWVAAQWRAGVTAALVTGAPHAAPLARALTHRPTVEEQLVDGVPVTAYMPHGNKQHPAIMVIVGGNARGRHQPDVERLGRALARAGFLTFVPDLPGMRSGNVQADVVEVGGNLVRDLALRPEVRDHRVALASASVGASLALLIAELPVTRGRVSAVGAVAPYAKVDSLVRIATTDSYRDSAGRPVDVERQRWMEEAVVRTTFALLPQQGIAGQLLARTQAEALHKQHPTEALASVTNLRLPDPAGPVLRLLANHDGDRFDTLWAQLPPSVLARLEPLSPLAGAARLDMPVELAVAPHDTLVPADEARQLAKAAPQAHLSTSEAFAHDATDAERRERTSLVGLDRFLVRFLRAASRS